MDISSWKFVLYVINNIVKLKPLNSHNGCFKIMNAHGPIKKQSNPINYTADNIRVFFHLFINVVLSYKHVRMTCIFVGFKDYIGF